MKGRDELRAKRVAILLRRRGRHDVEQIVAAFEAGESAAEVARRFRTSRQNAWLWQQLLIDSPPPHRCREVAEALEGAPPPRITLVEPAPAPPEPPRRPSHLPAVLLVAAILALAASLVLC